MCAKRSGHLNDPELDDIPEPVTVEDAAET